MKFTDKQFNDILKINKIFTRLTIVVFIISMVGISVGLGTLTASGKTLCGTLTLFGTMAGVMAYNPLSRKIKRRMVRKALGFRKDQQAYIIVFNRFSVKPIDVLDGDITEIDKDFFDSLFIKQIDALAALAQYKNTLCEEVKRYLDRDNDWSEGEKIELIANYRTFMGTVLGCDATIDNLMVDHFVSYMAKQIEERKSHENETENSKKVLNEYFE